MIGKIILGKSFTGCISYVLENKLNSAKNSKQINRAELISFNQCFGDKKELIKQFNDVRFLNPKLTKPVMHLILSLSPDDKPDKATLISMAEDCAESLGFTKNQFIAVTHNDTYHLHLHLVVNRVGFDGKTLSDSNNYKKIADYCRKMELKYSLKQVASPMAFLPKEKRSIPRLDSRKEAMKTDVRICLLESKSYAEFERLLRTKGYEVIKARGIAFRDGKKMYAKGSELGYSLSRIEKILRLTFTEKQSVISRDIRKENPSFQDLKLIRPGTIKTSVQESQPFLPIALEILLKPAQNFEPDPYPLLIKKRKKKRSLHL